ncbi:protein kinase [Rhodovulum sulfidophilum]|uniref:Protein kinase n=1 Tax=Rhodovulum sulfidophilum TaxID=35806 RepID=A0A0D6AYV1_RHOSU|nr:protein kinase [Rhodovulum sulfidophilum]
MRHGTRQLFGERARHGAKHPKPGRVLRRHVAGFYSAVDTRQLCHEGLDGIPADVPFRWSGA